MSFAAYYAYIRILNEMLIRQTELHVPFPTRSFLSFSNLLLLLVRVWLRERVNSYKSLCETVSDCSQNYLSSRVTCILIMLLCCHRFAMYELNCNRMKLVIKNQLAGIDARMQYLSSERNKLTSMYILDCIKDFVKGTENKVLDYLICFYIYLSFDQTSLPSPNRDFFPRPFSISYIWRLFLEIKKLYMLIYSYMLIY